MKLLLVIAASTAIARQEAALLATHASSLDAGVSLGGPKASRESETNMTLDQALQALPPVPSDLKSFLVVRMGRNISSFIRTSDGHMDGTRSLRGSEKKVSLIGVEQDPDPHNIHALQGSAGAIEMLKKLLVENVEKFDSEHARCHGFRLSQKREIAEVSLAIAQFTANANKAHGEVLLAEGRLSYTGEQLPKMREALQRHVSTCEKSQNLLNTELHTHQREQAQMEFIVSLAECNQSTTPTLIQCPSKRRGRQSVSFFSFGTEPTKQAVAQLKLAATRQAVQDVLKDAYRTAIDLRVDAPNPTSSCWTNIRCPYDWKSSQDPKVCQSADGSDKCDLGYCAGQPTLNMMSCNTGPHIGPQADPSESTKCWMSWPCPFMMVRTGDGSVCKSDAPDVLTCGLGSCAGDNDPNKKTLPQCAAEDSWTTTLPPDFKEKCNVRNNPDCPNLADKLMFMLSDVSDRVSRLHQEASKMEMDCRKVEDNMKEQIENLVKIETDATADLALALKTLNENNVAAKEKQTEFHRLTGEMTRVLATCVDGKELLYREKCSIIKIREEIYKLRSVNGKPGEVRDCVMSVWEVDRPCSATCGFATMLQKRTIQIPPLNGAPCAPKVQEVECDTPIGCPVPCKLGTWSGWTECSSGCGGGVEQRSRAIEQHPYNNGAPCEITSESRTCNLQACNVPCVLKPWTKWSKCSKQCGKGHRSRVRAIKHKAVGEGDCPSARDPERLWTMSCHEEACKPAEYAPYLRCESKMDLVLVLDGSGSMRRKGFEHLKLAAQKLIDSLDLGAERVWLSAMVFSGPRTWRDMYKCRDGSIADLERCGVKWVTGNSSDSRWTVRKWEAIERVRDLQWPRGGTLTGLALGEAKNELGRGRTDAPSTVIVITDGKPSYYTKTKEAARSLRHDARLMFVPIGNSVKFDNFKRLASHPLDENIIPNSQHAPMKNLDELERPNFQTMLMENACPELL